MKLIKIDLYERLKEQIEDAITKAANFQKELLKKEVDKLRMEFPGVYLDRFVYDERWDAGDIEEIYGDITVKYYEGGDSYRSFRMPIKALGDAEDEGENFIRTHVARVIEKKRTQLQADKERSQAAKRKQLEDLKKEFGEE